MVNLVYLPEEPIVNSTIDEKNIFGDKIINVLGLLKAIVSRTDKLKEDNKDRYENYDQIDVNNVISIIGPRGSGKTSVLLSVEDCLEKTSDEALSRIKAMKPLLEPRYFTSTNSILQLVISKLFASFRDSVANDPTLDSDESIAHIMSLFQKLNDGLLFDNEKDSLPSSLDNLESFCQLFSTKRNLIELVDKYLSLINLKEGKRYTNLLFIIDDLDLDSVHAYKIISQISKFLRCPNLIFVLSFDEETMESVVQRGKTSEMLAQPNYFEFLLKKSDLDEKINVFLENCAQSFLEKLVPERYKVFLDKRPSIYDSFYQYIFRVICREDADKYEEYYPDVLGLIESGNLRHRNQAFNLLVKPSLSDSISEKDRFCSVFDSLSFLLFNDTAENHLEKIPSLPSKYDDFLYTRNSPKRNKDVFFNQLLAIQHFVESGASLSFYKFMFAQYGTDSSGILTIQNGITIGDLKQIDQLNPMKFFELMSMINKIQTPNALGITQFVNSVRLYLPDAISADNMLVGFNESIGVEALELRTKRQNEFLEKIRESIMMARRKRGKQLLSTLLENIDLAIKNDVISEKDEIVQGIRKDIISTVKLTTTDSRYRPSYSDVLASAMDRFGYEYRSLSD
jgi:hypothetical protein